MQMNILNPSKEELFTFIKKNKLYHYVIVMFTAEWCGYCRRMLTIFEQLLAEREKKDILFLPMDVEKNSLLSKDPFFSILTIPKTFIFKEGNLWKQLDGSKDFYSLKKFLQL